MSTTHLTVKATDVTCPVCHAAVTEHCVSETGRKAKIHTARRREAEQAELDLNDPTKAVTVEVIDHSPKSTEAEEPELGAHQQGEERYPVGSEIAPGITVVSDEPALPGVVKQAPREPAFYGDGSPTAVTGSKKAAKGSKKAAPAPAPAPAATEAPEGQTGTVKDAYSKERKAVKATNGTVSIFTESRNRWFVTKDLRVAASFKADA